MTPDEALWAAVAAAGGPPVAHVGVSPSGGDDTANIKAAVAAAVAAGQANGSNYGEVWFDATKGPFSLVGAVDTSQGGRAQIPFPYIVANGSAQKFVLVLRGTRDGSAGPHWQQTGVQQAGAALASNLNLAYNAGIGAAAVIGGPRQEQVGSNIFSNMLVVIDGLTVVSTYVNPVHNAVDLSGIAEVNVKSLGLSGAVIPGTNQGTTVAPTNGAGLVMPRVGNNDYCEIGSLEVQGYSLGLDIGEHSHAASVRAIYCGTGVGTDGYDDAARIDYLSTEACNLHISSAGAGVGMHLDVGTWDTEDGNYLTRHLDDAGNLHHGTLGGFRRNTGGSLGNPPIISGGQFSKIINAWQPTGHVAPPAVPATTVALLNPFWRDAAVTITGGTVSAIAVDGTATGLAATGHTVIVPSGRTITLTYTVAPAWSWVLL